jgi:hypothetical protein
MCTRLASATHQPPATPPPHRTDGQQWGSFKESGLDSLRESHRVNGQISFDSPFAARDHLDTQAMRSRAYAGRAAAERKQQQQAAAGEGAGDPHARPAQ